MLTNLLLAGLISLTLVVQPLHAFAQEAEMGSSGSSSTQETIAPENSETSTETAPDVEMPTSTAELMPAPQETPFTSAGPSEALVTSTTETLDAGSTPTSTTRTGAESPPTHTTATNPLLLPQEPPPPPIASSASSTTTTSSLLCLAIIAPAPSSGPEWIAVRGITPSTSASFLAWSFADAQGSLLTVHPSTTLLWDEATRTMRVELRSARLNNGGDSVYLKNPEGDVHDAFTYPETERGHWWSREGCLDPWEPFPRPTIAVEPTPEEEASTQEPAAAPPEIGPTVVTQSLPTPDPVAVPTLPPNPPPSPTMESPSERQTFLAPPPGIIAEAPIQEPVKKTTATSVLTSRITKTTSTQKMKRAPKAATTKTTPAPKSNKKKTTPQKKATKKATPPKSTPPIPSVLMPPLLENPHEFQGIRVRLRGRVASQTNFLGAHTFVVVNEDGRGLLIKGTSKHPSPTFGSWVDLTGSVVWNDAGLTVKQAAADAWEPIHPETASSSEPFAARTVDLLAPSQEDAWSQVRVEGRVSAVQKTSFDVDVGDASVRVRLVSRLGYRAQRLEVGDSVTVQGLLDLRGDEPTILPQTIESIEIMARAIPPAPTPKAPVEQPWLPVGAAAGTLALSEGWRRFHAYRKQRQEAASFRRLLEASGKDQG